jgi:hypothetical protein
MVCAQLRQLHTLQFPATVADDGSVGIVLFNFQALSELRFAQTGMVRQQPLNWETLRHRLR